LQSQSQRPRSAARAFRHRPQTLGLDCGRAARTSGQHGVTGTGATDAPGQATTVSMPGMDTSILILSTIVPPPTRTPRAGIGTAI